MGLLKSVKNRIKATKHLGPFAVKCYKALKHEKSFVSKENSIKEGKVDLESESLMRKAEEETRELNEAKTHYEQFDKDHVWAFMSGHSSQDFRGNPKYLFVYINRYRPDIAAYWLCSDEKTISQVRSLGFTAYLLESPAAQYAIDCTGVLVAEQVKTSIPEGFEKVKYLNLWHGVGVKHIERKGFAKEQSLGLARKYITNNAFYRDHQLMTVTSPAIERDFIVDCALDPDNVLRTGYLRCEYQQNFEPFHSFDSDLRKIKGLPQSTSFAVYAPTYRATGEAMFSTAVPDLEKLYQCCERNKLLLIFKMHPWTENDQAFMKAKATYGDRPYFWFWDNQNDFYEIIDQIDLAIVDYSSIFSDLVASGVPHYIRYIYDFDEYLTDNKTQEREYFNRTFGYVCRSFEGLLLGIETYKERDDTVEFKRINNELWSYAGGKIDFEKTIQHVMDFKIVERCFPILYSFDVFDTLISRKVLEPLGIFSIVRDLMAEHGGFSQSVVRHYPEIRRSAELNVREFYRKSTELRHSERVEITFEEIFKRIADVYCLTDEQTELLVQWELETEIDNVIPLTEQIELVKKLVNNGEIVVLISDMYLPKDFVQKMLRKADPVLADLPLFLSSEYGVMKTSQKLFFEVYKSFEPFYDFKKWIHYGDNPSVDINPARKFKICTRQISKPAFNEIQNKMVQYLQTGDGYLVGAMQARMCVNTLSQRDEFVVSYIALTLVPYVDWVLRDAMRRGYQTLYFVSRDGYHLKRIADEIIRVRGLNLRTKYIYASRRTWRIPSYIDKVDEGFWLGYGNFTDLTSKEKLLKAMDLDEDTFRQFFPTIDPDTIDFNNKKIFSEIRAIFRNSEAYNTYLLETAAKERGLVEGYLKQEINFNESFAFVEYYGRGYNQDCLIRLLQNITGNKMQVPFYYMRTVLPTMGDAIRHHFTTNSTAPYFMESIFANMPYKSIEDYKINECGSIEPIIVPINCDMDLFDSMNRILPEFAACYTSLELRHPEDTDRLLQEFVFDYFQDNRDNPAFAENIGTLWDSVALYGNKREFAPAYTEDNLRQFSEKELGRGDMRLTTNVTMSVTRSSKEVQERYFELYQILPGDNVAGGRVLSEIELTENRSFKQKYEDLLEEAEIYRKVYDAAVKETSVQNKVLIVAAGKTLGHSGLELLEESLREHSEIETVVISIKALQKNKEKIATELATAKFVVVSRPIAQFCKIQFRPETQEIMLNNVAISIYYQCLSTDCFLKWKTKYKRLAGQNDISVLQIPSKYMEKTYRRDFSNHSMTNCSLLGCCNTDNYYRKNASEEALQNLLRVFPEASGKKILLYMPKVRRRKSCKEWLSILDMESLQKLIGKEYVVVVNFNPHQLKGEYFNTIEIPSFSKMINKEVPLRHLMLASDIIVGDYRDTFFESALLHKPVFFTVSDYEDIIKGKNCAVANQFEKYIFGPIITTAQDLANQLENIEKYDFAPMEHFRTEMLAKCDGNSVNRVVEYLLNMGNE